MEKRPATERVGTPAAQPPPGEVVVGQLVTQADIDAANADHYEEAREAMKQSRIPPFTPRLPDSSSSKA